VRFAVRRAAAIDPEPRRVDASQASASTIARRPPVIGCLTPVVNGKLMGSPHRARTAKNAKHSASTASPRPPTAFAQIGSTPRAGMNRLDQHRVLPPAAPQQVGYGVLLAAVL
jgi:hypothetical protein